MGRRISLFVLLTVLALCCVGRAEEISSSRDYTLWRDLPAKSSPTPLPPSLNGRTVVLRWNGKHNSDKLLLRLREHLGKAFPGATLVLSHEVNPALSRIPPSIHDAKDNVNGLLALSPTVVIAATGDCRSCVGWLTVEQVLLEEKGVATITLVTQPFYKTFQAVRQNMRMAEMLCVVVPHPVGNLPAAKVQAKADAAAVELMRLLAK